MRRAAVILLSLLSLPALAAEIPDDAKEALRCGLVFSLRSEDAKLAGDEGGATEWSYRGTELLDRGRLMLADAGFDAAAIGTIVDNSALISGFSYGADPDGEFESCLGLAE